MTQSPSTISGALVRAIATGVLFMACFGTLWASIGAAGLQGWGSPWFLLLSLLVGIGLLIGGIRLFIASRRLPNYVSKDDARQGKRTGVGFGIIFATEIVFIFVASVICNALHRFDLFYPIMALIVGLHFFPLAYLFQAKFYFLVGALLCLLAIISLLAVPESDTFGSQLIMLRWVVLGFSAALILWAVGVWLWLRNRRLLALSKPPAV